jgi:hypothetical protein
MAETHILAVHTYGLQRVEHPTARKRISGYKIGYTSAASALLLALLGERAQNVSPPRASYHYIQIDGDVAVHHSYILLKLTADELQRAVAVSRQHHRAAAYLWRDNRWHELPNSRQPDYAAVLAGSQPNFDPTGIRATSPASGERESVTADIRVEKSQRSPTEQPWWWLHGDTYPHRELLKRHGARWSRKRRAWYYIGAELPTAFQAMISPSASLDESNPLQATNTVLGSSIEEPPPSIEPPLRLSGLDDVAYARHELETVDGNSIATGASGKVVKLYQHDETQGWSYDVDFEDVGVCWSFERELTTHPTVPGIKITHGAVTPFSASLLPTDADMKRTMLENDHQPAAEETVADNDSVDEAVLLDDEERPSAIRIIKPAPMPANADALDAVQTAVRSIIETPVMVVPEVAPTNNRTSRIEQAYVGELTGSITGQVFCYGYALYEGICIYVNMAGPRMGVEAIRAKLSKGDQVSIVPMDAPAIELTAGEGNSGMYHPYLHYLPEARFASLILVHDWAVTPNYGGKATTFIFRASDAQATAKLKHHVMQLVNIPVFDAWSAYLYDAGQRAMLVRKTHSEGGIDLLSVDLDADAWTRLITVGIEQRIIHLPDIS